MTSWVVALLLSWRWLPSFDFDLIARETAPPPREEKTPERTTLAPPATPSRPNVVADEVVVRALDRSRAAFLGCWRRAVAADPLLEATKVTVRVELDAAGKVLKVTHDATNAKLGNCLVVVAGGLAFDAPNAVAEFPLFFQPD